MGYNCDNCWYMSLNDPICTIDGGQWLAEKNVCERWADKKIGPDNVEELMRREG